MIDLYYWSTPNGHKVTIFLEEAKMDYNVIPIDIGKGDQFKPEFLKIAPNNKIPAIVDHNPEFDVEPLPLFESGCILLYLAEKTKKFIPADPRKKYEVLQWLFWQMGGLGPMLGQNHHFNRYAPVKIPYAIERYVKETSRLYQVLDNQLKHSEYIAGEYSIADMAAYPWTVSHGAQGQNIDDFPNFKRWFLKIQERPAVKKAYAIQEKLKTRRELTDEDKKILFNQGANVLSPDKKI